MNYEELVQYIERTERPLSSRRFQCSLLNAKDFLIPVKFEKTHLNKWTEKEMSTLKNVPFKNSAVHKVSQKA